MSAVGGIVAPHTVAAAKIHVPASVTPNGIVIASHTRGNKCALAGLQQYASMQP